MNFRKFRKNTKALTPVIASIILIMVAVSVSIVSAAWLAGTATGLMGSAEQVSIINVAFPNDNTIQVMVHNAAGIQSSITNAFINGVPLTPFTSVSVPQNSSIFITLNSAGNGTILRSGTSYTIKLITAKGAQIVSPATLYSPCP
jgi:flagellin-like protein